MVDTSVALTLALVAGSFAADACLAPRIRSRRWRERVTNVCCGLSRYAVHGLVNGLFLAAYSAIHAVSPLTLRASSPWTWLFAFFAFDLLIFLTHYLSHRVPLLWAIHSVHHQPVEIDVTVGLRTHLLTSLFYLPLLLPLALLGIPVEVFLPLGAVRLAAMALTHARLRTPRWLDVFLNTPELHAVHHSADPRHYDKNIGGILMLWDHLFGTYMPRERVARCGLPGAQARSALEANWLPFRELGLRATRLLRAFAAGLALLSLLLVTACLGASRARPIEAPSAVGPGSIDSLKTLSVGVPVPEIAYEDDRWLHSPLRKKELDFMETDRLIRLLRQSDLFAAVDYVTALPSPPDLVATPIAHISSSDDGRDITVANIVYLGLLPAWGTRDEGCSLALSRAGSDRRIELHFEYPVQWIFGWPVLIFWGAGWRPGGIDIDHDPEWSRSFRTFLVGRSAEIASVAKDPGSESVQGP